MSANSRPKRIVSIDWDTRTLRVVHAHLGKRGVKIDRLLSVPIPAGVDAADADQMGKHISRTLGQEGISTKHAIVDIPRDQAILKTLKLPVSQPDELAGVVQIQIAKELPFPVEGAVIDYAVESTPDEGSSADVLVGAVRKEQLEQYEATFLAAGLKLDRVGLRPYANAVAARALLRHAMPDRVLFIDVRPTFMEIDVLKHSALAFSRSASVVIPRGVGGSASSSVREDGSGDQSADSDSVTYPALSIGGGGQLSEGGVDPVIRSLMLEVTRSIEAYRAGDPGARIDHAVIAGDVGVEEALAEAIQKQLDVTTEIYNPASTFGWEPDEGAGASAYSSALGLVLGHAEVGSQHFDFLHPKEIVSATKERLKKAPMLAAVIVVFLAAGAVSFGAYTSKPRQKLASIEKKIKTLKKKRSDNKKFLAFADSIDSFDSRQHVWVDVMFDVFSLLPTNETMVIEHLEMNQKDGRLTLKTKAKGRDTATQVIRALNGFRREGMESTRFKARMGPQTTKKKDEYTFRQDLRIRILDDKSGKKGKKKASRG